MMFLSSTPDLAETWREATLLGPGLKTIAGTLTLVVLFGPIPLAGMTSIEVPSNPIAVLRAMLVWALGYLLGRHLPCLRRWHRSGDPMPALTGHLLALACGVIGILIDGWLMVLAFFLLGTSAIRADFLDMNMASTKPSRVAADYQ